MTDATATDPNVQEPDGKAADETSQAKDQQPWRDVFLRVQDGLKLHARVYGTASKLAPVVCLPGLTRNAKDFHDIAMYLSSDANQKRMVVCVDYRGRGQSDRAPDWKDYTIEQEAKDLLATLTRLNIEHAHFIGTSRGGLILFALTAMRPAAMKSVVLNDIGPVVEATGLARIKSYSGNMAPQKTIEQAAEYIETVHKQQFPALDSMGWLKLAGQLYLQGKTRAIPDYDNKLLKSFDYLDLSKPLPTIWPQFEALKHVPTMVLRGQKSDILSIETVDKMKKIHPAMVAKTITDEGHAPLLWDRSTQDVILEHFNKADGLT